MLRAKGWRPGGLAPVLRHHFSCQVAHGGAVNAFSFVNTSPSSGKRPICFLEKINVFPAMISNTPPDPLISRGF